MYRQEGAELYFNMAVLVQSLPLPLFCGIITQAHAKNGEELNWFGCLSYTWMRELFLAKWKELGLDASQFGLHRFRADACVTAAANAGVPDRLIKCHHCWWSEVPKYGYIKDS